MKLVIAAGFSALCLAGAGAGVPRVMAAVRPAPAGWPAAKAAAMANENNLRAAAAGRPVVAPGGTSSTGQGGAGTQPQAAAMAPRAAYTAGVLPLTAGGPFSSWQFVGTNLWNGPVNGQWEVVQAGGAPTNRSLGAASPTKAGLFVYTESSNPAAASGQRVTGVLVPSPDPAGTFTVTKATGSTLTLTLSGSGTRYTFNVETRKFTR
jgi:hypothetical protein